MSNYMGDRNDLDSIRSNPKEFDPEQHVAWDREETEPCERGTVGCSIRHNAGTDFSCETW